MPFRDRTDAGRRLASRLAHYRASNAVVLGLPRGGVPVAYVVATALQLPLDIVVVRKLGVPWHQELGMGAVAEGGVRWVDQSIVTAIGATSAQVDAIAARELTEVDRRVARWRGGHAPLSLTGKTAIVVDDGVATGGTMRAALLAVRARGPAQVVLAVPVAEASTLKELADAADVVVCDEPVRALFSIGAWYRDFRQVSDDKVTELLALARATAGEQDVAP
ncbi:MAG: phosphoribosyltransferase [Deltaproteobacteria bacterium]|nr:phosphoribosyltransferase [Deltaproteobacteria bacterium]